MRKLKEIVEFNVEHYTNKVKNLSDDDLVREFKDLKGKHKSRRVLDKKISIIIDEVNRRGAEKVDEANE